MKKRATTHWLCNYAFNLQRFSAIDMQNKKLPTNKVANIVVEETLPFFFKPPYHEVGQSGTLHGVLTRLRIRSIASIVYVLTEQKITWRKQILPHLNQAESWFQMKTKFLFHYSLRQLQKAARYRKL